MAKTSTHCSIYSGFFTLIFAWFFSIPVSFSQSAVSTIFVQGNLNNFYPVAFYDIGYNQNQPTKLVIGRSNVHQDANWRASLMASFTYHVNEWGNGSQFIEADIQQGNPGLPLVGGWADATYDSGTQSIVIWLRGGGTTYQVQGNYAPQAKVYDGVANPLIFNAGSSTFTFKTIIDSYVNFNGPSFTTIYSTQLGVNYFAGSICVGTTTPNGYQLAVNGSAVFTKAVIKNYTSWPDFVFNPDYQSAPLESILPFVKEHRHLPGIPSAATIKESGLDLGDMQRLQMQKIEELTLYLIKEDQQLKRQDSLLQSQQKELDHLKRQVLQH